MNYSITKNGKELPKSKYTIDLENKTFSSKEDDLVLDFASLGGWTFTTGWDCTFKTGSSCTFNTGDYCTFKTGSDCVFKTGWDCTFKTGSSCTFNTGDYCTILSWNRGKYLPFIITEAGIYKIEEGKLIKK